MTQLIWSRRLGLVCLILIGVLFLKNAPFVISAGILLLALWFDPATLRPLKNYRFWLIVSFLVILVPIFTGDQDGEFLCVAYSTLQFDAMILMALRGIDVFLLFQTLSTNLDSNKARQLFQRLGISHFDLLFSISKETLPRIRSILKARVHKLREPNKNRLQLGQFIPFAVAVIQDMINMAESYSLEPEGLDSTTPHNILNEILSNPGPQLLVISGDPGTGKTPWVVDLLRTLQDSGYQVGGLISEKVTKDSGHWHHQLRRIVDDSVMDLNTMDSFATKTHVGKFYFYPHAVEWGVDALLKALSDDWIIIDETGHLEFQRKGFFPALVKIDKHFTGHLVLTVRSSLITELDSFLAENLPNLAERKRHKVALQLPLTIPSPPNHFQYIQSFLSD